MELFGWFLQQQVYGVNGYCMYIIAKSGFEPWLWMLTVRILGNCTPIQVAFLYLQKKKKI